MKIFLRCLIGLVVLYGCATSQQLPDIIYSRTIYPADHYRIYAESEGLRVMAIPFAPGRDVYADPAGPAEKQTGVALNVIEGGILPVRLIVINESRDEILLDPDQIIGISDSVSYRPYSPQEAIGLVVQSAAFKKSIKGSQVGPLLKSILGGELIIEAAKSGVRGVASGGIAGGATGVAKGATGVGLERTQGYEKVLIRLITREYTERAIQRQTLYPGFIADGLVFLPSQAGIKEFIIRAYGQNSKKAISLQLRLSD